MLPSARSPHTGRYSRVHIGERGSLQRVATGSEGGGSDAQPRDAAQISAITRGRILNSVLLVSSVCSLARERQRSESLVVACSQELVAASPRDPSHFPAHLPRSSLGLASMQPRMNTASAERSENGPPIVVRRRAA